MQDKDNNEEKELQDVPSDCPFSGDPLPKRRDAASGKKSVVELTGPDIDGYIIKQKLGSGAHGEVYLAERTSLGLMVAIKVMSPGASRHSQLIERFKREIRTYHTLNHPNVVQLRIDGVCVRGHYSGCPFVVMEYMNGGSLKHWLAERNRSNPAALRQGVKILIEICKGLSCLHDADVVHRDLKPANVLLSDLEIMDGVNCPQQVRVADFGLVAFLSESRELSHSGMFVGTPVYMAPEQFTDGKRITPAADQYAMGIMLYELLCGRRPWQSSAETQEEPGVVEAAARSKTPSPHPRSNEHRIDSHLREICLRCLEPDPQDRYKNIEQTSESLQAWLDGEIDPHGKSWVKRAWRDCISRPIKSNPTLSLVTVIACILACLGLAFVHQGLAYHWPHNERFAEVINFKGIPRGIGPLSVSESQQRYYHYQIQRKGWYGKIQSVTLMNKNDEPFQRAPLFATPLEMFQHDPELFLHSEITPCDLLGRKPVRWEYQYSATGELLWVIEKNTNGEELTRMQFASADVAEFKACKIPAQLGEVTTLVSGTAPRSRFGVDWGTDIEQIEFVWNEEGLCEQETYFGRDGQPTIDEAGAYGWHREFDAVGRTTSLTCLGANHQPADCDDGFTHVRIRHQDQVINYVFEDAFENEVAHRRIGAAQVRAEFRSDGTLGTFSFFGNGMPTTSKFGDNQIRCEWVEPAFEIQHLDSNNRAVHRGDGVHRVSAKYDNRGLLTAVRYFSETDQAVSQADLGVHELRITYQEQLRIQSLEMLDEGQNPKRGKLGASRYQFLWNQCGLPTGMSLFHKDEKVVGRFLAHRTQIDYDETQRVKRWSCYGKDGDKVNCWSGFHARTFDYGAVGKIVAASYWKADGSRAFNPIVGYHRAEWKYDARGNETSWASWGTQNEPIAEPDYGYHRMERVYDEDNQCVQTIALDSDGNRILDRSGICEHRYTWAAGLKTSAAIFGTEGEPLNLPGTQWHRWTVQSKRIAGRDCLETRYWGADDTKATTAHGYHLVREFTDSQGNIIEGAYFDTQDQAVKIADGYHRFKAEYDSQGRQIVGCAFDSDNQPVLAWDGCHRWEKTYDAAGNEIEGRFFDTDGLTPILADGHSRWSATYNDSGQQLSWQCFDTAGEPANCRQGFHRWSRELARAGSLGEKCYWNASGERVVKVARVLETKSPDLHRSDLIIGRSQAYDVAWVERVLAEPKTETDQGTAASFMNQIFSLSESAFAKRSLTVLRDDKVLPIEDPKQLLLTSVQMEPAFIPESRVRR